mgnify:CR=1 FL=1
MQMKKRINQTTNNASHLGQEEEKGKLGNPNYYSAEKKKAAVQDDLLNWLISGKPHKVSKKEAKWLAQKHINHSKPDMEQMKWDEEKKDEMKARIEIAKQKDWEWR